MSTHGLKGEVKVYLMTDSYQEWFKPGAKVFIKISDGSYKEETISSFYVVPGNTGLLILQGRNRIEDVQDILKCYIYGEKKDLKGLIYLSDLIGDEVRDEKGQKIGTVSSIEKIGGKDYLKVNETFIPYVPDVFISTIDYEKKIINLTKEGSEVYLNA